MSDERSLTLHRASPEYRELASKLRELARVHLPRTAEKPYAAHGVVRSLGSPFRLPGCARRRSVIGETPRMGGWVLVGLLVLVMLLLGLKR
jgi:hypothetical protein